MAWYCAEDVYYRGRVVQAYFRYDGLMTLSVVAGKPLPLTRHGQLTRRDQTKIKRILRRQKKAFGVRCDHGCGGPYRE